MLTLNLVIVLGIVGFLIGVSKTAFGGLGLVSVAILANFTIAGQNESTNPIQNATLPFGGQSPPRDNPPTHMIGIPD